MSDQFRILLVMNTRTTAGVLKRRLGEHGHDVVVVESPEALANALSEKASDAILMDDRLLDVDPYDLAKAVRSRSTVPMIYLTQMPTRREVIAAARAGFKSILVKPFAQAELIRKIASVTSREMPTQIESKLDADLPEKLAALVDRLGELMAVPFVVERVLSITSDDDSGARDLDKALRTDPSSSAAVLKQANSALYSGNRRISNLTDAIARIGFKAVRGLVLGLKILDMFSKDQESLSFDRVEFWKHSVSTGIVARYLARKAGLTHLEEDAFICGLLADLGRMILDVHFTDEYSQVVEHAATRRIPLLEAEREAFETDSQFVGRTMLKRWDFPETLIDAVGCHLNLARIETTLEEDSKRMAQLVWAAGAMTRTLQIGFSGDRYVADMPESLIREYKVQGGLADLREEIDQEFKEMTSFLGVDEKRAFSALGPDPHVPSRTILVDRTSRFLWNVPETVLSTLGYELVFEAAGPTDPARHLVLVDAADAGSAVKGVNRNLELKLPMIVLVPKAELPAEHAREGYGLVVRDDIVYLSKPFDVVELTEAAQRLIGDADGE